jgi:hypothetical protein
MPQAFTAGADPNLAPIEDAKNRVNDMPRGNFQFAYHPDDWQLNQDAELVPVISHMPKTPGCNGVDKNGDFTPARIRYENLGYRLINHDVLPGGYVAVYRNKKGSKVHRTVFQRGHDFQGVTHWLHDGKAWSGFIKLLRQRGIIQQPKPEVVLAMLKIKRQVYEGMRQPRVDDAAGLTRYNEKVERMQREIATLEREMKASEELYGEATSPVRDTVLAELAALADEPVPVPETKAPETKARRRAK